MRLSRRPRANPTGEMSILEHIGELRNRLAKSCAALVVATLVAFTTWRMVANLKALAASVQA
ncbi:MAG TPA: hypothetical protein VFQ49_15110, partial [Actinomycetes bacterium]|nr:hypothetical protein [Actinomycetes bacterium]